MNKMTHCEFSYNSRWINFLNIALITLITAGSLILLISHFFKQSPLYMIAIFFVANLSSMFLTGALLLSYIHYKSPYNCIKFDHDAIIVPKNKIIPDSNCIYYDQIIYHSVIDEEFDQYLQIVYNGGAVRINRSHLKNPQDWDELIYNFKEMII